MSGDPRHADEAQRWLRYAHEDLELAYHVLRERSAVPRHVCFLAQQAAEKAIKAVLVALGTSFPRTHDLDRLRGLVPEHHPIWQHQPASLAGLTDWAVDARYPDEITDPTWADADKAYQDAAHVVDPAGQQSPR